MKLGIISTIVTIIICIADILVFAVVGDNFGVVFALLAALAPAAVHAAVSARQYKRFKTGIRKYVLLNALCPLIIGASGLAVCTLLCAVNGISRGDYDCAEYQGFWFNLFMMCYSAVYGALLSAVLAVVKRKERA